MIQFWSWTHPNCQSRYGPIQFTHFEEARIKMLQKRAGVISDETSDVQDVKMCLLLQQSRALFDECRRNCRSIVSQKTSKMSCANFSVRELPIVASFWISHGHQEEHRNTTDHRCFSDASSTHVLWAHNICFYTIICMIDEQRQKKFPGGQTKGRGRSPCCMTELKNDVSKCC